MNGVVIQFRDRARGNVSVSMVLWATAMAVVLFLAESGLAERRTMWWIGFGATTLFGIYLGWHRRSAPIFVAPIVSWIFAWFPLWIAAMIEHGFFRGLVWGLFLVTVGWIAIGFAEFVWIGAVSFVVRLLHGPSRHDDGDVVIFGPDGR